MQLQRQMGFATTLPTADIPLWEPSLEALSHAYVDSLAAAARAGGALVHVCTLVRRDGARAHDTFSEEQIWEEHIERGHFVGTNPCTTARGLKPWVVRSPGRFEWPAFACLARQMRLCKWKAAPCTREPCGASRTTAHPRKIRRSPADNMCRVAIADGHIGSGAIRWFMPSRGWSRRP